MAFDMYLGKQKAYIDHYEEGFLVLVNEDPKYPKLTWLYSEFYDGPTIIPVSANEIAHELIQLKAQLDDKKILQVIDRLLPFFSKSFKKNISIKCVSD